MRGTVVHRRKRSGHRKPFKRVGAGIPRHFNSVGLAQTAPSTQSAALRYQCFVTLNFLGSANSTWSTAKSLILNSTFRPGGVLNTLQPMGRDDLAAIYKEYRVVGCLVEFQISPMTLTSDSYAPSHLFRQRVRNASDLAAENVVLNEWTAKRRDGKITHVHGAALNSFPVRYSYSKKYYDMAKSIGRTLVEADWTEVGATPATNQVQLDLQLLNPICIQSLSGQVDFASLLRVRLTQYVQFRGKELLLTQN